MKLAFKQKLFAATLAFSATCALPACSIFDQHVEETAEVITQIVEEPLSGARMSSSDAIGESLFIDSEIKIAEARRAANTNSAIAGVPTSND